MHNWNHIQIKNTSNKTNSPINHTFWLTSSDDIASAANNCTTIKFACRRPKLKTDVQSCPIKAHTEKHSYEALIKRLNEKLVI